MAELIEQIISDEAFKQVDKMKSELSALQKQFEELIKATESGGGGGGGSPRNKALSEYERLLNQITKSQERLNAMQTTAGVAYTEAQEALRQYNAELKDANRMSKAEEGSIDQMRVKLKQLEQQYSSLSSASRNAIVGKDMLKDLVAVRTELGKLESTMGNFKRNVGNYTNATFQMSQVLRELPAFTFSAQTGMMALSNNLPMLGDAFKSVMASGKTATQTIGIFAKSIFSLGNIFTIAMSAFIIFQKEITAFISGTKEADKSVHGLKESIEDMAKSVSAEIVTLTNLYKISTDVTMSMDKRKEAVDELQKLYPAYFKNLSDETILVGNAKEAYDDLVESMMDTAIFKGFEKEMQPMIENIVQLTKQRDDLIRRRDSGEGYQSDQAGMIKDVSKVQEQYNKDIAYQNQLIQEAKESLQEQYESAKEYFNLVRREQEKNGTSSKGGRRNQEVDRIEELKKLYEQERQVAETHYLKGEMSYLEYHMELLKIDEDYGGRRLEAIKNLSKKELLTRSEYQLQIAKNTKETWDDFIKYADDVAKEFDKKTKEANKTGTQANMMDSARQTLEMLKRILPKSVSVNIKLVTDKDEMLAQLNLIKEFFDRAMDIAQSYVDVVGQKELIMLEKRKRVMDEYYDAEQDRINNSYTNQQDRERELAKMNARKKAEEKAYEAQKRISLRNQAIMQKKVDVMAAISGGALAIIKQIIATPLPAGAPFIALAGVTAATQIAKAVATPIPEFAKGTESSPEGYAIVGEKGHEMVEEPSGKKWITPARNTLTYLKKGSKVITNEKLMKMVQDNAYIQLAESGKVTTDTYGKALIDQFEALSNEMKGLKTIMANKEMSAKIYGNFDHYMHVKNNIR